MSDTAEQIIARGPRAIAEAAAVAIDADPALEEATYSILEEDEDHGVWRIDAFPTTAEEADGLVALLGGFDGLKVTREALADADWLAMALSGLPPVRAGRFFVYGMHDRGRTPPNALQHHQRGPEMRKSLQQLRNIETDHRRSRLTFDTDEHEIID